MHSSRMHTRRSFDRMPESTSRGGGCACSQGGVPGPGGCLVPGGCLLQGGAWSRGGGGGIPACTEADTPTVNRMTDRCQKYYLGHNFVAAGKNLKFNNFGLD